jgi:hypothetical protein
VEWDQGLVDRLDLALNESTVCGLRYDADAGEARLLIEVDALPEAGPIDPDPRRVVVMSPVESIEVTLRTHRVDGYGPVMPLDSFDDLERFFAGLKWANAMYGWEFVDVADPGPAWQVEPSLQARRGGGVAAHSLRWFTECGKTSGDGEPRSYVLQGVVWFADLRVERADARPVSLEEFAADARRWWDAFQGRDARVSVAAQRQAHAGAASWRSWPDLQ